MLGIFFFIWHGPKLNCLGYTRQLQIVFLVFWVWSTFALFIYVSKQEGGGEVAHSCTRFPCYLGMEINAKTQWTTTKIVELGNYLVTGTPCNINRTCLLGCLGLLAHPSHIHGEIWPHSTQFWLEFRLHLHSVNNIFFGTLCISWYMIWYCFLSIQSRHVE